MQDSLIAASLVAGTDHLRAALIRKTRTDRIVGRSGLRPSWAPPSYVAHGQIGLCDLAEVTRTYYHVKRGAISPDDVIDTWHRVIRAARTGDSIASVIARAINEQVPGLVVASTTPKAALAQVAEYSAITAMCVGAVTTTAHRVMHDTGKLKLEINNQRIYLGKEDSYIARRLLPLWDANRTCDNPRGRRERAECKMVLLVDHISKELPEYAKRTMWLARLALHTGNDVEVTKGFDIIVEKGLDDDSPVAVLSHAITQAVHHKPVDLRALSRILVPGCMTNSEFSTMTLGYQRDIPVQFSGHDRTDFISLATTKRDQMSPVDPSKGGKAAFELERRLKS